MATSLLQISIGGWCQDPSKVQGYNLITAVIHVPVDPQRPLTLTPLEMGELSISHQGPFLNVGLWAPATNVPRRTWSTQVGKIKGGGSGRTGRSPGELQGAQPEGEMVREAEQLKAGGLFSLWSKLTKAHFTFSRYLEF